MNYQVVIIMVKNKCNKINSIVLRTLILSSALALCGCSNKESKNNTDTKTISMNEKTTITAIINDNNKILLIDLKNYEKYISYLHYSSSDAITRDRTWALTTTNDEVLFFDEDNVFCFIKSQNSHEKALAIATYYYGDDVEEYEKLYNSLKLKNN